MKIHCIFGKIFFPNLFHLKSRFKAQMEIENLIKKMKDINSALIDFIEATDEQDAEFKTLIEILDKQEILENKDDVQLLFRLISKIADNHHRESDFIDKLEKIFQYLIKDHQQYHILFQIIQIITN